MKHEPTNEQAAVVDSGHPKLVVRAAAGAGKTRVLVDRYLKHVVRDRLSPDQILTITFTRKAAAEMKVRIVSLLRQEGLYDEAQIAETGPIQTIHGFCERLLRENALEAGLDPEFEIMAGAQSARALEDAIRLALGASDDSPYVQKLIADLAGRRSYNEWSSPHSLLSKSVREILHVLRPTGMSSAELEDAHEDPDGVLKSWERALVAEQPADVRESLLQDSSGDELATRLIKAFKAANVKKPKWVRPPTPDADLICAEHTAGLVRIAASAWRLLEKSMAREQTLDFTALEAKAVDLVRRSEKTRARLRKQYRVALVDEGQDVNPVQYELLEALAIETQMFVGDAQQSIYGFRQANIELFRSKAADAHELRLSKNWRSDPGILGFVDVLFGRMWANDYAPMLNGKPEIDLDSTDSVQIMFGIEFWLQQARDTGMTASWIKALLDEGTPIEMQDGTSRPASPADVCVLVRRAKYGLDLLPRLEALNVPARIAGGTERFYARLEVRDLANALRALADPFDDFALLSALRSPLAALSLDSIVLLGSQKPVVDHLADFEPPLEEDRRAISEFRRWFMPMREYADRLSAWEILSEILSKTQYLDRLARRPGAEQQIANVRKLVALAADEPDLGPLEYARRLEEVQSLQHPEGDAPATDEAEGSVTIMTIHKAKGLEFPIVIVPETHWAPATRSNEVETDPWLKLVATKFTHQPSLYHSWLESRRHLRDEEEELRVLYVAMTRAQKRLCICLHPKLRNPSWLAARICREIGYTDEASLPPGVKLRV